jgi:hypothetical protein
MPTDDDIARLSSLIMEMCATLAHTHGKRASSAFLGWVNTTLPQKTNPVGTNANDPTVDTNRYPVGLVIQTAPG